MNELDLNQIFHVFIEMLPADVSVFLPEDGQTVLTSQSRYRVSN